MSVGVEKGFVFTSLESKQDCIKRYIYLYVLLVISAPQHLITVVKQIDFSSSCSEGARNEMQVTQLICRVAWGSQQVFAAVQHIFFSLTKNCHFSNGNTMTIEVFKMIFCFFSLFLNLYSCFSPLILMFLCLFSS